jgi:hypothetical protein
VNSILLGRGLPQFLCRDSEKGNAMTNTQNLKKAAELGLGVTSLLFLLASCGGGSGSGSAPLPTPLALGFEGSAVKGPVSAATVNIDSNNDGVCGGAGDAAAVSTNGDGFFTFPTATAEAHTVCVEGGTDTITGADLTGTTLTAPPSANPVVTPLTTLVDGQVRASGGNVNSSADVAVAAGKIAGALDLTPSQVVPATPDSALTVEATANAVQTLLSGTARAVASAASGTTVASMYPAASRGTGSAIANASTTQGLTAATTLPVTREAIRQAVIQAQAEPGVSAAVAALSPDMVSEIVAPALAAHVAAIAAATPETLQSVVAEENAKTEELVSAMSEISSLMTAPVANAIGITTNGTAANTLAAAVTSAATDGLPAAAANLGAAANEVVNAGVAQGVPLDPITVRWHGLVLSSPKINNTPVTTTTQPYSVTVAGPLSSASLDVAINGKPEFSSKTSANFRAREVGGSRELWLFIDKVNVANNNGTIAVTIPASAKLYAYGKNGTGTTYRAVLVNAAANVLTSHNNVITVDWTAAMNALAAQPGFANLSLARGTFDVMVAMNGAPLYMNNASVISRAPSIATTAPVAAGFPNGGSFSGKGLTIRVTVN